MFNPQYAILIKKGFISQISNAKSDKEGNIGLDLAKNKILPFR
jgi:hypothetical protein